MKNDTIVVEKGSYETKNNVGIIIPSLDPTEKLIELVENLHKNNYFNVIVINDGSAKSYNKIFDKLEKDLYVKVLKHEINLGKGQALKTAFLYMLENKKDIEYLITVDSDGQHQINDINKCYDKICTNPNAVVFGCRDFFNNTENIPSRSKFGNRLTHRLLKLFYKINLSDTQTGLRAFSRSNAENFIKVRGERFEYEMNMILECGKQKIEILEVPIETIYLEENKSSHFNPIVDSFKIYSVFFKFIISSITAFLVDISIFSIIMFFIGTLFSSAIFIATYSARVISAICNYLINKNKVFKSKSSKVNSSIKYFVLCVVIATISAVLVDWLDKKWGANVTVLKICVDMLLFVVSYKMQKWWVFK